MHTRSQTLRSPAEVSWIRTAVFGQSTTASRPSRRWFGFAQRFERANSGCGQFERTLESASIQRRAWTDTPSIPFERRSPVRPPEFRRRKLRRSRGSAEEKRPSCGRSGFAQRFERTISVAVGASGLARMRRFNALSWADNGPIPLARCCPVRPPLPMPPIGVAHSRNAGFFPIRESRPSPGCAGYARPFDLDAWDCDAGERIAASSSTPRRGRGGSGHVPQSCEFASRGFTCGRYRQAIRKGDFASRRQVRAGDGAGCAPIRELADTDSPAMAAGREFDSAWRDGDRSRFQCPAGPKPRFGPERDRTAVARQFEPAHL